MLFKKEHYDLLSNFENQFKHRRLDKEKKTCGMRASSTKMAMSMSFSLHFGEATLLACTNQVMQPSGPERTRNDHQRPTRLDATAVCA